MDWFVKFAEPASLLTLVLAILTGVYVWLTHRILKSQTDPYVVVYARSDELRPSLIELVIENAGRGVARNVRFELSRPIPWRAYGLTPEDVRPAQEMTDGPLITGIPALGPGDRRRITWGQFGGLTRALGTDVVTVTARFETGNTEMPPVVSAIDIRSFARTDASDRDPTRLLAREVRRLAESSARIERILDRLAETPTAEGETEGGTGAA